MYNSQLNYSLFNIVIMPSVLEILLSLDDNLEILKCFQFFCFMHQTFCQQLMTSNAEISPILALHKPELSLLQNSNS